MEPGEVDLSWIRSRRIRSAGHKAEVPFARHPQVGFPTGFDAVEQSADDVLAEELDEVRRAGSAQSERSVSSASSIKLQEFGVKAVERVIGPDRKTGKWGLTVTASRWPPTPS